jgi:hypothetical protein
MCFLLFEKLEIDCISFIKYSRHRYATRKAKPHICARWGEIIATPTDKIKVQNDSEGICCQTGPAEDTLGKDKTTP